MLIYFLTVIFVLSIFITKFIKNYIQVDIYKFLEIVVNVEENSNKTLTLLKIYLNKLKLNLIFNNIELLLVKNLETKLVKKIK